VFHTSVVDLQPRCRNGGILNHWLSTTACPTGKHLRGSPRPTAWPAAALVVLTIVAGVPQVPPGRARPSPTVRLATGPGPYALFTMLALMGAAMRGPPDAQNWRIWPPEDSRSADLSHARNRHRSEIVRADYNLPAVTLRDREKYHPEPVEAYRSRSMM
jgi:hypothetical protein